MTIQILLFIAFGIIALWMLINPLTKKKKKKTDYTPSVTPLPTDVITIEQPMEVGTEINEMPTRPLPVNCQKAMFNPYPETYFYTDCCGNEFSGEGYQEFEKRSPVSIDSNKPFQGMTLLDVEAEIEC